jgi:hypothetical protein
MKVGQSRTKKWIAERVFHMKSKGYILERALTSATAIASSSLTPCSFNSKTRQAKTLAGGGANPLILKEFGQLLNFVYDMTEIKLCYNEKTGKKNIWE